MRAYSGRATWQVPIPAVCELSGRRFYQQALVLARGANAAGAVTSNGIAAVVGR